jgi:CheY-like chemotaxis protein
MPRPKVLIVEDEFLIRLTLAEALADDGFEVIEAANGAEALQALPADGALALLLTDIQLPGGMNGMEVARRLRGQVPDLPVIFMTGRPDRSETTPASDRDLFIAKPYLPSEVCAAARRLTGR